MSNKNIFLSLLSNLVSCWCSWMSSPPARSLSQLTLPWPPQSLPSWLVRCLQDYLSVRCQCLEEAAGSPSPPLLQNNKMGNFFASLAQRRLNQGHGPPNAWELRVFSFYYSAHLKVWSPGEQSSAAAAATLSGVETVLQGKSSAQHQEAETGNDVALWKSLEAWADSREIDRWTDSLQWLLPLSALKNTHEELSSQEIIAKIKKWKNLLWC